MQATDRQGNIRIGLEFSYSLFCSCHVMFTSGCSMFGLRWLVARCRSFKDEMNAKGEKLVVAGGRRRRLVEGLVR